MPFWILTFFLGVTGLSLCRTLPSLLWLLLTALLLSVWLVLFFRCRHYNPIIGKVEWGKHILMAGRHLLVFTLGFSWALIYVHLITVWSLPQELEGKKILVTGYIASLPHNKPHGIGFEFKTESIGDKKIATKLKLSWYGNYHKVKAGEKWQLLVRLKRPHGVLNPGGFDLEKHLLIHHLRAAGYVIDSELNQILRSHFYYYPLTKIRQILIDQMDRSLMDKSLAPIVIAFVTGVEDRITPTQWQVMRDTGTSYLVAIAGLHIGLVATIAFIFISFLWRFSSRLPLITPAKEAGIIGGLIIGFIYGAVSGFSIPTQRSLVMLVIFSLTILWRRHAKSWNAWLWSLFLVLVINPLSILTMGFWLSFSAVASIIYATSNRISQKLSHLSKFWRMQYTVTLALLPLTLLFFQQFSFITILANLIAMPAVCMVIVPMSLLGALCLLVSGNFGSWVLLGSVKLLHLVWWWLTFLSKSFNICWYHPVFNWWILVTACIGVLILLAPRGFPAKSIGLLWLVPLCFYKPPTPSSYGEVWFTLLDVGQGLAAVVQTKNHVLLYDTGPRFFEHDAGASVVVPYLRKQGVTTIDTMVVSHGDSDHSGGASSILQTVPVANILTSVPEIFVPHFATPCYNGQHWQWDGVDFQILSPDRGGYLDGNDASCVLKVTSGNNSILLPGDIERYAEDRLIANHRSDLKSTILVAPHHGSATSSTSTFISSIMPKYVIFPVGYRNRFHFPNKKIMARYVETEALPLNASYTGAITFKFTDKSDILGTSFYREQNRRFWHD